MTSPAQRPPAPPAPDAPVFETFGCRLNAYETEAMKELAAERGLGDAVVVNTCAVTAEAVRQARQRIRRLRRDHPEARVIVTGCAAQTEPETFAAMPEVDLVLGNLEKMDGRAWDRLAHEARGLIPETEPVRVDDIMSARETAGHLIDGFGARSRAYVQVQNGCDHRCTFCIIPYGRGNARSVPAGVVVEQIRRLVANGWNEIVLTGVDLTSWGADLPGRPPLGDLVQRILRLAPDLPRLRLSSIDSIEADPALMDALSEPRFMPHLHLSLQAGDDMVLKRMKRRHLRDDAIRFCEEARRRRPDIVFGADLIAGFPTETDAMHDASMRIVDECGLTWLHVFPFSPRQGTPAARMPQVDRATAKTRAAALRAAGEARRDAWLAGRIGGVERALIEKPGLGRTEGFAEIVVPEALPAGGVETVRVDAVENGRLRAA
ncbi:MAG: tRNA (N(6)-L-threonylcarbamoyladenosine(37)-C(2))-methylthiotransferase MtaB [Pseudomonadota bacterium]